MTTDTATPLSSRAVIEGTGLTYRQLDYWIRIGVIAPSEIGPRQGNGYWRRWSERDRLRLKAIAGAMHDLHRFGLPSSSALVRNLWLDLEDSDTATIGRGRSVTITVTLDVLDGVS